MGDCEIENCKCCKQREHAWNQYHRVMRQRDELQIANQKLEAKIRAKEINGTLRGYDGMAERYDALIDELEVKLKSAKGMMTRQDWNMKDPFSLNVLEALEKIKAFKGE